MRKSIYLEIKKSLWEAIKDGRYRAGSVLPPVMELARIFKASNKTVVKAITALSDDGVIDTKRGKGNFVRPLKQQSTTSKRIGVVHSGAAKHFKNRWPGDVFASLRKSLQDAGYSVHPYSLIDYNPLVVVDRLQGEDLAGVVLFEITSDRLITDFKALHIPIICLDYDATRLGVSSVVFDNYLGSILATNSLLKLGHCRISFMRPLNFHLYTGGTVPYLDAADEERALGYRLAMMAAGLPVQIETYPEDEGSLRQKVLEIFARRPAPTALLFKSPGNARKVLPEIERLGYRVPDDLSVVGFDCADIICPGKKKMATVQLYMQEMGREGARLMVHQIIKENETPEQVILPIKVQLNDTVKAIEASIPNSTS